MSKGSGHYIKVQGPRGLNWTRIDQLSVISFARCTPYMLLEQCQAINVGFELYIGIESKLSISIIGFDLELGEFCHDFHSISIPINHSGTHFNLPAISTSLK